MEQHSQHVIAYLDHLYAKFGTVDRTIRYYRAATAGEVGKMARILAPRPWSKPLELR